MNKIIRNSITGAGSFGVIVGLAAYSFGDSQKDTIDSMSAAEKYNDVSRPNIIYILADDIGYGEMGFLGQMQIETPNLDQLATEGMVFTDHYTSSPSCAPARCMLLTGLHSGKAQIRANDEMPERGDVWDYQVMLSNPVMEGQRSLKAGTVTIGSLLQSVGYKTAVIGKWGLGAPYSTGLPNQQGFDFFYGYLCQRQAHTFYPVHLWRNDKRHYLFNDVVPPHDHLPDDADPYDLNSYDPYNLNDYSSELMFEEITRFVDKNANNHFFLYWATPIPHLPLQAPKKWVDYYVKKFGDEEPYTGREGRGGYFPTRYPRATYAGMISYLDENVGKMVQQLKDLGLYDNTLIIFTSDNGPTDFVMDWFDSAEPFRSEPGYVKTHLNEGGIRMPMIAVWPHVINPGSKTDHISAHYDVLPTLTDITGISTPEEVSGMSFLPTLKGENQQQPEFLYWEFPARGGQMAVRIGKFKALRKNMHNGNLEWELFDLDRDPKELDDISSSHPEVIRKVEEIVAREHTVSQNERFRFPVLGE